MNHMTLSSLRFAAVLLLALGIIAPASSQLMQLRFVTSAYAWQNQDTDGASSSHLFGYQTAQFSLAGDRLSFHTYLQGFNDFAGPVKNDPRLRMYNLYLRYAGLFDRVDLSLGRQLVFGGVGNGTIDGLSATARFLDSQIKVLGYYGALPAPGNEVKLIDNPTDNAMFGLRVSGSPVEFAQVSLSYLHKSILPETYAAIRYDTTETSFVTEIRPNAMTEQLLGGDVTIDKGPVSGYARYAFDLEHEQTDRIQLFTRVEALEGLSLTGEYLRREPRLSFNSIFWVFTLNPVTEVEGGVEYALDPAWQLFAKYGTVSYGADEKSDRISVGANWTYASASVGWSTGDAGELKSFAVNAGYPLFDNMITPTLAASYAHYKLSDETPEEGALTLAGGVVYRPLQALSVDGQVQLVTNKIYANDVRVFLRASYHLSHRLNIF